MQNNKKSELKKYSRLYPNLMGYAVALCKDHTLASDLVQDTMLRQLEQHHDNLSEKEITYWCKRVLKNRYLDILKKKKESQFNPEIPEDEQLSDETNVRLGVGLYGKQAGKSGFNILPSGEGNSFMRLLYSKCMGQLREEHRDVMIENVIAGKTASEIAEEFSRPLNTILTWLTKAKLQFHGCIMGEV